MYLRKAAQVSGAERARFKSMIVAWLPSFWSHEGAVGKPGRAVHSNMLSQWRSDAVHHPAYCKEYLIYGAFGI